MSKPRSLNIDSLSKPRSLYIDSSSKPRSLYIDSLLKPKSLYIDSLSKPRQLASGIIGSCSDWVFFELKFSYVPLIFVLRL